MPSNKYDSKDNTQKIDSQQQGFKQICFQTLHCLLRSNQNIHNIFYYLIMFIQFLQIFFYITHPFFPYYKNSVIMGSFHQFVKYLVFNEFLSSNSSIYQFVLPLCALFILIQLILLAVIVKQIKQKKLITKVKKIHFIANAMFLILNTILTIPFFGMSFNVLYCDADSNRYTLGQQCYTGPHIGYCLLAVFIIIALVVQWGIYWYIYYNKNPFGLDFLSKYENNAVLGKFLIKIIPIIYLNVDFQLKLIDVFAFGITACVCGYIFFFRLFSYHDYNQFNFYFVLFLQVILAWFSVNNIILSYLDSQRKAGGLFQSFLCSLLIGALVLQIQEESYKKIFMQAMETDKIKKQNIQKFLYRLIYIFLHSQSEEQKNNLSTIVKILNSKFKQNSDLPVGALKMNKKLQKKFYSFLNKFLTEYIESNSNTMLYAVNCHLLMCEQKFSFAFHQSLQLSNKKINLIEQLMMYRFRRHTRYDKQKLDTNKKQNSNIFMMYYDFNQNLMKLEEEIASCAFNNLDYWEEVCESNPSIYKIRNLAQKYQKHQENIDLYYNKIYQIFPNNKLALKSYIQFLMYVGVNIKSLAKAHERYEQAQQNLKKTKQLERDSGNLIEMGQNQNLAYISIQTNQVALGNINSCNSEFKKMLGYEKHELIDKKVNKIMPKTFSQFHDGIVRNYIQKKQHNQKNKVERVVYALSKQSFIVEVVLFTKVNYKTIGQRSGLELIGFLKRIQDPNKAVIILEMNSQNIVGANAGFSTLIDDGISNSEFANSQIKICTLLPSLNGQMIQQGKTQETNLIFSSSVIVTRSGLNLQVKKKVLIQVQQIREYSTKQKFAYLVLKELISEQKLEKNAQNTRKQTLEAIKMLNKKNEFLQNDFVQKQPQRKVKVLSSQVSIMDNHSIQTRTLESGTLAPLAPGSDKQYQSFHMIQRKKQQFLKNQHLDIFRYILWLSLIVFISITIAVFVYSTVLNYKLTDDSRQIKQQIINSYSITYQTARINKNIQKIMQGSAYNETEFNKHTTNLSQSINQFQQNFIPLMTMSVQYDFPLQLNQFKYYNIVIQKQQGIPQYAEETIIDAFFQYISSAKNYASYTLLDVTTNAIHQMVEQNAFIQQNGKELFPLISKKMSLQYLDLNQNLFSSHQNKQLLITISYCANMVLAFVLIAILIRKINTFNQSVVQLYNQIKLWDANQMKFKCLKFIENNSTASTKSQTQSKKRISSLLNVFPQQAFLKVLDSMTVDNQHENSGKNLNNSSQDDQLLKLDTNQNDQPKQVLQNRASQKQRKFYVFLMEKNKLRTKFSIFAIIGSLFIAIYFVKYVFSHQYERKTIYYNTRISELGRVRDNLAFMNYYSYQLMIKPQDPDFRRLLQSQTAEFYTNTNACYDLIGDPSTILRSSYNLVEEITALIFSQTLQIPNAQRYSIRNGKYLVQQALFDDSITKITKLINQDISQSAQKLFASIKAINIAFCLIYIFLTILFAFLIKCWMLQQILRNSKKSKSMILMLPPWLVERNKGIQNILQ